MDVFSLVFFPNSLCLGACTLARERPREEAALIFYVARSYDPNSLFLKKRKKCIMVLQSTDTLPSNLGFPPPKKTNLKIIIKRGIGEGNRVLA